MCVCAICAICAICAVNDSTNSNVFGSELLPFVDRVRPEMSRPRTVAGLYQKNTAACWKVMKTKSKLSKEVEHKHDRPWATPHSHSSKAKTLFKPATDDQGTMTMETFLKIKDQIVKQDANIGNIAKSECQMYVLWRRATLYFPCLFSCMDARNL